MFVVLDIYEIKHEQNISVYSEPLPNSPDASRPIALVMGKENYETLSEWIPIIQSEISDIQEDGLCIKIDSRVVNLEIEIKSSMTDGKIKTIETGRDGAYCIVSNCSRDDGNTSKCYTDEFSLKCVSLPELWNMFFSIEKDGEISKRIPSKDQIGLTNKPLLSSTNVNYLPVLHVLLRVFDWALKVVYHRHANLSSWIENVGNQEVLKLSKKEIQGIFRKLNRY
ncbi:unnamed protein product [Meganyctiphanes norvegica]|uniref:V(D)J recombination-activating protein 1 RNase H domain-containing protein n=1 Tax=Meganyctiphanes norvegica TaxID=48144 RepID=A0AAV2PS57_MEGNR